MSKDIYRNKKDFAKQEFATEIPEHRGQPVPREVKSQKAQLESFGSPGMVERKDKKVKMGHKLK
ncbi:MAG: hypothetical protein N3I35_04620 [Clostridia bacterium]|nr:hypothetical protein [Clostridia bacterium]